MDAPVKKHMPESLRTSLMDAPGSTFADSARRPPRKKNRSLTIELSDASDHMSSGPRTVGGMPANTSSQPSSKKPHVPIVASYSCADTQVLESMFALLEGTNRYRVSVKHGTPVGPSLLPFRTRSQEGQNNGAFVSDDPTLGVNGPSEPEPAPEHSSMLTTANFHGTLTFLGVAVTREEVATMWEAVPLPHDGVLQTEHFAEMTVDALRDIHNDAHSRTPEHLWATVFRKLQIIEDARELQGKVLNLHELYGLNNVAPQDSNERINIAAQLMHDAMRRRGAHHRLTKDGRAMYQKLNNFQRVFALGVWVNFSLGFVEDSGHEDHEWFSEMHVDGRLYYVVPVVQLLCVVVHLWHCLWRARSSIHWVNDRWLIYKLICALIVGVDAGLILLKGIGSAPHTRILRAVILMDLYPAVRKLNNQFWNSISALKEIMLLGLVGLIFYVLAGLMMYPNADEHSKPVIHGTSEGKEVFTSFHERTMQLVYLAFGAVNYPDVMLPAYVEDGSMALVYFVSCAIFFIYVFLNIALAVIYNRYTQDREDDIVRQNAKRHIAMALAYQVIDENGSKTIDFDEFKKFMHCYRELDVNSKYNETHVTEELEQLWTDLQPSLNHDGKEEIGPTEFIRLPGMLSSKTFQKPPLWAVRGLHWQMKDISIENIHIIEVDPNDKTKKYHRIIRDKDPTPKVGQEVVVARTYAWLGDEPRVLCRRLKKSHTAMHDGVALDRTHTRSGRYMGVEPLLSRSQTNQTQNHGRERAHPCNNIRDITEPENHKLDFDHGKPIVWKRREDVHDEDEYVLFIGKITDVEQQDGKTVCDICCNFDNSKSADNTDPHGSHDFFHGGLLPWLREILLHRAFMWFINCTIVISMVLSILQYGFREWLIRKNHSQLGHVIADYLITIIFDCEMLLKWFAFGFSGYWRSTWHRLDGIICVLVTISTVSLFWDHLTPANNSPEHRYWEILKFMRAVRVFRVLNLLAALQYVGSPKIQVDKYRLIFAVTSKAMRSMFNFFVFGACAFYVFSVVGMSWFGGPDGLTRNFDKSCNYAASLHLKNQSVSNPILARTSYDGAEYTSIGVCGKSVNLSGIPTELEWGTVKSYYYGINFDSMAASFIALLHLLIMNNWHVTHAACVKLFEELSDTNCKDLPAGLQGTACQLIYSKWVVSAYFVVFVWLVAIVLVNILLSFFLDIYQFAWSEYTKNFDVHNNSRADTAILEVVHDLDKIWAAKQTHDVHVRRQHYHRAIFGMCDDHFVTNIPLTPNKMYKSVQGKKKCASCLLSEPVVRDIKYRFCPLFVPSYGMFSSINGYDVAVMCDACCIHWRAMEMLTCDRGIIYGSKGEDVTVSEAMAANDICNDNANMQLKIRIMLKLADKMENLPLGIPKVPLEAVDINAYG